ncbi:MAG: type II toxin-antitoxin system RelE/ParE family toxin [Puniceicoccales bacterium]|nr:type II toxin-antitoxin system RelE/ParE family toxin [Puniceicoccales bacterium]
MNRIVWTRRSKKQLASLAPENRERILRYLTEVIEVVPPCSVGKRLGGGLHGLWRYRVGDYRLIVQIDDQQLRVLLLAIGHRREVYRR